MKKFDKNNHFGDIITEDDLERIFPEGKPQWITEITREGLKVTVDAPVTGETEIEITQKDVDDYFNTDHGFQTMHNIKGVYFDHRQAGNFMLEMAAILNALIEPYLEE